MRMRTKQFTSDDTTDGWEGQAVMHIADTIKSRQLVPTGTIGEQSSKPIGPIDTIGSSKNIKLSKEEVLGCDVALSQYKDLMHPDFYAWHCKAFYAIGRERYHILASQARADGKDPARLFSHLLRKELS